MAYHSIQSLEILVATYLQGAGANTKMAQSTARALVAAEAQGLASHGLSRVTQYAAHLKNGRVKADANPHVLHESGASCLIDAEEGLAFPACELAVAEAIQRAQCYGIAFVGVTRSHHGGVLAEHLRVVADAKMVGIALSNSPAAMPTWGGQRALLGTNPIAAVFPRHHLPPLVIDLSLTEVARGKLMIAAKAGEEIPLGWALDSKGHPTTDPHEGLKGMMCPAGGLKGSMLALVIELLCCALTGAAFGFEADSFFVEAGNRPRIGQAFLVVDPRGLAGQTLYFERIETLIDAMQQDETVRLPGARRQQLYALSQQHGIEVDADLMQILQAAI